MDDFAYAERRKDIAAFTCYAVRLTKLLQIRDSYIKSGIWVTEPEKCKDFERALYALIVKESEEVVREGKLLNAEL